MEIPNVCSPEAPNNFTCPGVTTFFTAAVFWGTIGPKKIFGTGGQYTPILAGFPIGVVFTVLMYYFQRRYKHVRWMRQINPVVVFAGAFIWAPYNMSYVLPGVPIAFISWILIKNRHLAFWSKYNYVLSASFDSAIALAGVVIFFALQYRGIELKWWGNKIASSGYEGTAYTRPIPEGQDHFGPGPGEFK